MTINGSNYIEAVTMYNMQSMKGEKSKYLWQSINKSILNNIKRLKSQHFEIISKITNHNNGF